MKFKSDCWVYPETGNESSQTCRQLSSTGRNYLYCFWYS